MYTSGAMTRRLPYLAELQPGLFCEVDKDLAAKRGLENGEWATIISPRGVIEAQVLVTDRMKMLQINGEEFHQIGLPFHYGESDTTEVAGDGANDLLGLTLEPNVFIQNSKIGACDIQPGRRPRGQARRDLLVEYQQRAQLTVDSGNELLTGEDGSVSDAASRQQRLDAVGKSEYGPENRADQHNPDESEEGK